jgi:hypothetical protein
LVETAYGKGNAAIEAAVAYVVKKNPAPAAEKKATVATTAVAA